MNGCPYCKRPLGWVIRERARIELTPKGRAYNAARRLKEAVGA